MNEYLHTLLHVDENCWVLLPKVSGAPNVNFRKISVQKTI